MDVNEKLINIQFGNNSRNVALCRLCAKKLPEKKLYDLNKDIAIHHDINLKLTRINSAVDFSDVDLPATVCFVCYNSLQDAYEFVTTVERAKIELDELKPTFCKNNIKEYIKTEILDDTQIITVNLAPKCDVSPFLEHNYASYKQYGYSTGSPLNNNIDSNSTTVNTERNDFNTAARTLNNDQSAKIKEPVIIRKKSCSSDTKYTTSIHNYSKTMKMLQITPFKNKTDDITDIVCVDKSINIPTEVTQTKQITPSWKDYKWKCSECETQFPNCGELIDHSIQQHSRCNSFSCLKCKRKTSTLKVLINHVNRSHTDIRNDLKDSCHKCFKIFNSHLEKLNHSAAHIDTEHTCPGCNTSFKTAEELNTHIHEYYKPRIGWKEGLKEFDGKYKDLTCLVCNRSYGSGFILHEHFKRIHGNKIKPAVCETCGRKFSHEGALRSHMVTHSELRPFKCKVCQLTFKCLNRLKRHVVAHDGNKRFSCKTCNKKFRTANLLKNHQIVHTDLQPFACDVCEKRFKRKTYLTNHLRQHTGVKSFSCEPCNHLFTYWANYNKHMKALHGVDMTKKKRIEPNDGGVVKNITDKNLLEWIEENKPVIRNQKRVV